MAPGEGGLSVLPEQRTHVLRVPLVRPRRAGLRRLADGIRIAPGRGRGPRRRAGGGAVRGGRGRLPGLRVGAPARVPLCHVGGGAGARVRAGRVRVASAR